MHGLQYTDISRMIMSPAELQMQPTIHFQSELDYFKFLIVLLLFHDGFDFNI
jgi:hypothetical protein